MVRTDPIRPRLYKDVTNHGTDQLLARIATVAAGHACRREPNRHWSRDTTASPRRRPLSALLFGSTRSQTGRSLTNLANPAIYGLVVHDDSYDPASSSALPGLKTGV